MWTVEPIDVPRDDQRATNVRWAVFSLAFATSWMLYLHRYMFAFVKPFLAEEWGLTNTQLGQLDSAFSVCYTLMQFPLAILADAVGVHFVLTALILVWCSGMGLMAWSPSARWMWIALATLGTGQSAVYACLSRVARLWYPPAVRTTLLGSVGVLAGRLGALSSSLVFSTLLIGMWGLEWRTAVGILAALGFALALAFIGNFRNTPSQHPRVNSTEAQLIAGSESIASLSADRMTLGATLKSMTPRSLLNLACLSIQTLLSTFADNIYSNWIPLFLSQVHHLDYKRMGLYAAMPLLGGAIAGLIGGALNDYCIARTGNRRWSRVGVALVGKGLAAGLMFAALNFYDRPYVFCTFLFFVKLFGDWSLSTSLGVVTDIGGRATASVFAFNNSVAGIALIAAPIVYGAVADRYGWPLVFVTVGATYALCALSWLAIDCTIPVLRESPARAD